MDRGLGRFRENMEAAILCQGARADHFFQGSWKIATIHAVRASNVGSSCPRTARVQSAKGGRDMRDRLRLMLGVAVAATMALSAGRAHAEDPHAAHTYYRARED